MRNGADCLSKWVGEAELQLRVTFEQVRATTTSPTTTAANPFSSHRWTTKSLSQHRSAETRQLLPPNHSSLFCRVYPEVLVCCCSPLTLARLWPVGAGVPPPAFDHLLRRDRWVSPGPQLQAGPDTLLRRLHPPRPHGKRPRPSPSALGTGHARLSTSGRVILCAHPNHEPTHHG